MSSVIKRRLLNTFVDVLTGERSQVFESANEFHSWKMFIDFLVQKKIFVRSMELFVIGGIDENVSNGHVSYVRDFHLDPGRPDLDGHPLRQYTDNLEAAWIDPSLGYSSEKVDAILKNILEFMEARERNEYAAE